MKKPTDERRNRIVNNQEPTYAKGPGSSVEETTISVTLPLHVRFVVQDDTRPRSPYVSGHITVEVTSDIGRFKKMFALPTWTKEQIIERELPRFASWGAA